ncbi:MAG: TIGR01212 family radical SAM protein [Clostridia bacterium]|nr:TIGR01212 family radical SAM protein [Clostridia bacterium]
MERYNHLNTYLKEKFGERTLKICIDAGFTCPNRDGTKGVGGCIFCGERGSGEHLKTIDIASQVENHLASYRGMRANKFIVYFQNFTNTYDSIENLKKKYDSALIDERIVGIQIATRPDCINEEIARLLFSYTDKYSVCVELGLQTSNENTGKVINRCYTNEDFINAVTILRKYNLEIVTHIMVGLPGETHKDIVNSVNFVNNLDIQGLKIHSTYVTNDTRLNDMYENNQYSPITLEYYLDELCYIITHLRKDIILHRISGDAPKDMLVAPSWNSHKKLVLNGIDKILREKDLYQGMYYTVEE